MPSTIFLPGCRQYYVDIGHRVQAIARASAAGNKPKPIICKCISLSVWLQRFNIWLFYLWFYCFNKNRPLALRGHVTNASFKQWVGILLMPKIDRARKNYFTPEIWEETHFREIFYGTSTFQQSSMICIGRHFGGHTLALQHGGRNYFLLISC